MSDLEQALFGQILKESKPLMDGKLIGFYGSKDMDSKLTLLSIGMGLGNKSQLLRVIVDEYLDKHDPVDLISKNIKKIRQARPDIKLVEYKSKIQEYLQEKNVDKDLITQVLKQL